MIYTRLHPREDSTRKIFDLGGGCMSEEFLNEIAKKFWFSLMPSIGYEPMYLTEVLPPDGYSTQYGWRPKRD